MWQIRQMIALALLAVCSYTDIRERSIYLLPLLVSSGGVAAMIVVSCVFSSPGEGYGIIWHEIAVPVIAGIVILIAVKAAGAYIGLGDGYLMASLGLITGIRTGLYTIFAAFAGASVYALVRVISGRRRFAKEIPFAPFVMSGFMVILINEI